MESKKTIPELFLSNSFSECHKWAHYLSIYETHLSRFNNKKPVLLEIGVRKGGSLGIWKEYFGQESTIIGVDIDKKCSSLKTHGFEIYIGDQSDDKLLDTITEEHPHIDIVIDDGSHIASDIIKTFECLYSKISDNGIYIIEDVSAEILGNKSRDNSGQSLGEYFHGIAKQINLGFADQALLNEAEKYAKNLPKSPENISHSKLARAVPPTGITATTNSILFYPNMIVLEKSPQTTRTSLKTAGMKEGVSEGYRTFLLK